jgi:hypothetical protein
MADRQVPRNAKAVTISAFLSRRPGSRNDGNRKIEESSFRSFSRK